MPILPTWTHFTYDPLAKTAVDPATGVARLVTPTPLATSAINTAPSYFTPAQRAAAERFAAARAALGTLAGVISFDTYHHTVTLLRLQPLEVTLAQPYLPKGWLDSAKAALDAPSPTPPGVYSYYHCGLQARVASLAKGWRLAIRRGVICRHSYGASPHVVSGNARRHLLAVVDPLASALITEVRQIVGPRLAVLWCDGLPAAGRTTAPVDDPATVAPAAAAVAA